MRKVILYIIKDDFDIDVSINNFNSECGLIFTNNTYIKKSEVEGLKNTYSLFYKNTKKIWIFALRKDRRMLKSFYSKYDSLDTSRENHNQIYIDKLKKTEGLELNEIFGKPFEDKQLEAIFHDEDHNLIIAGAGTGKTHTLLGKAVYLTKFRGIPEDKILVISFTNKIVDEVKERMENYGIKNIEVLTFHKLGNKILKQNDGPKSILDPITNDKIKIIDSILSDLLETNENFKKIIVDYFVKYLKPFKSAQEFASLSDYYQYLKDNRPLTLNKENVKSYEEAKIANFLARNGINYEYESAYKYDLGTQYKPDFYLTDYDIYLEHFAINKDGGSPFRDYVKGMEWKRKQHRLYGTKLVETYSYQFSSGLALHDLEQELKKHGVKFCQLTNDQIIEKLKTSPEYKSFSKLLSTFLGLFKSNGENYNNLYEKQENERNKRFLEVFKMIFDRYKDKLEEHKKIDFDDMINNATEHYREESNNVDKYKYILIDEFQDISIGRYNLIKTILEKNTGCQLFAVGDDWQSIFRFAGSDLDIFTEFSKKFKYTQEVILDKCFRFGTHQLDISGKFIMKNKKQIAKQLLGADDLAKPITVVFYNELDKEEKIKNIIDSINQRYENKNKTIKFLSRYNKGSFLLSDDLKHEIRSSFNNEGSEFNLTCHKAKGLEADFVFVNSLENEYHGFPCKKWDDPVLNMVLNLQEEIDYAEERRLFYVAITRSKIETYLFANSKNPSSFVTELIHDNPNKVSTIGQSYIMKRSGICPLCGGNMYKKMNRYGKEFDACSNYPYCKKIKIIF